jgi:hypothetical protein
MRFILKITIFSIFLASPIFAANVRLAQTLLNDLNYSPGTIDGQYGEKTKDALVRFYDLQNMKFDGELSENEISDLQTETTKFQTRANQITFPGQYYTKDIKSCKAMENKSFEFKGNINLVEALIGYDWPTDHATNSNSQNVQHSNITKPIKIFMQATHNAIAANDQASINIAKDLLFRIADADTLYDSIGFTDLKKKPMCYANGDPNSRCWYHEYEFARGVFSNYMIVALWLQKQLSPSEYEIVDRYINRMYAKFLRPIELRKQDQGFYQMANGGLSILIYASWANNKELAADEINFRFTEMNRLIFPDGYINNNSFRGVRSQWYHSYGLDIALGYVYIAELWGAEIPETLKYKLLNASKVANLAITNWEKFKSRQFTGRSHNAIKGQANAIKHTHQMAIAIDTLMLIVTGIELENDPIYLKKRNYHAIDGVDDLIGFNANCI